MTNRGEARLTKEDIELLFGGDPDIDGMPMDNIERVVTTMLTGLGNTALEGKAAELSTDTDSAQGGQIE